MTQDTGKEYTGSVRDAHTGTSKLPPEQKRDRSVTMDAAFWAENAGRISRRWQRIILLLKRHMMY